MDRKKFFEMIKDEKYARFCPTGSRYICGSGADEDWLIQVENLSFLTSMAVKGFTLETPEHYGLGTEFYSLRNGEINIIATKSPAFYDKFYLATEVSKRLCLKNKPDRVAVFRAFLYNEFPVHPDETPVFEDQS